MQTRAGDVQGAWEGRERGSVVCKDLGSSVPVVEGEPNSDGLLVRDVAHKERSFEGEPHGGRRAPI